MYIVNICDTKHLTCYSYELHVQDIQNIYNKYAISNSKYLYNKKIVDHQYITGK